jgi:hypothetical protein
VFRHRVGVAAGVLLVGATLSWTPAAGGTLSWTPAAGASPEAASVPATLYSVSLTGTAGIQAVYNDSFGDTFTTTGTWALDGTTTFSGESQVYTDVWIPDAAVGATDTVYGLVNPNNDAYVATDPTATLTTTGSYVTGTDEAPVTFDCTDQMLNELVPEIGVSTTGAGNSIEVDWTGDAYPNNPAGNANNFPESCNDGGLPDFEIQTPLVNGSPAFNLPWSAGYDTLRFAFGAASGAAASQTLTGSSESEVAGQGGIGDPDMGCPASAGSSTVAASTCAESYTGMSEQMTMTKYCSGTVTVDPPIPGGATTSDVLTGTCGSPASGTAPTGTKIAKASIHGKDAAFTFSARGATGYQCALTHPGKTAAFASCKSPKVYDNLARGTYEFEVRGINATGDDKHPATKTFTVT